MSDRIRPSDLPYAGSTPKGVGFCKNENGDILWDSGGSISALGGGSVDVTAPLAIFFGDSIVAGGNNLTTGVSVTKTADTLATFTATSNGLAPGNQFWFSGADDDNGWGLFTVESRIDANSFTAIVPSDFPSSVPSTGGTKQIIPHVRQNDRNYVAGAIAEIGNVSGEVYNFGASGMRLDQILPVFKREVLARKPKITYLGAGTNEVLQSIPSDNVIDSLADAIQFGALNCEKFLIATLPPVGPSASGYLAAMGIAVLRINNFIRAEADKYLNVDVIDLYGDWTQATVNDYISTFSSDDIHPNGAAAQKTVAQVKAILTGFIPPSSYRVSNRVDRNSTDSSINQMLANPIMEGTAGTIAGVATGQAADTYTLTATGTFTTCAGSKETRSDGRGFNQIITVAGASAGATVDFLATNATSNLAAGNTLKAFMDLDVSGLTAVSQINAYLEVTVGGVTYLATTPIYGSSTGYTLTQAFRRYLSTNKFLLPGTPTVMRPRIQIVFAAGGAITLKVGCISVERG